jgi:ABC-type thiamine transport system ATPase subunit
MSGVNQPFGTMYETVAASQTAQVLGTTGAAGDTLMRLIVTVTIAATGAVSLLDGATSYALVAATTPVGVYVVEINATSVNGAWKVTTGAGATVMAVGNFT